MHVKADVGEYPYFAFAEARGCFLEK